MKKIDSAFWIQHLDPFVEEEKKKSSTTSSSSLELNLAPQVSYKTNLYASFSQPLQYRENF